jgi:hypothetical protein
MSLKKVDFPLGVQWPIEEEIPPHPLGEERLGMNVGEDPMDEEGRRPVRRSLLREFEETLVEKTQ